LLAAVSREIATHSGFQTCPRVAKLLADWDPWCAGGADPAPPERADTADSFWGV